MFVPSVTGPVGWKNYRHNWIFYLSRIQRGLRKSCAALRRIARYTPVLKHLLSDINELAVKRSKYKTKKRGSLGAGGIVLSFYDIFLRRCYASSGTNAMQRGVVKRGKPQKSTICLFRRRNAIFLFWPASVVNILNVSNAAGWCHCLEKVEKTFGRQMCRVTALVDLDFWASVAFTCKWVSSDHQLMTLLPVNFVLNALFISLIHVIQLTLHRFNLNSVHVNFIIFKLIIFNLIIFNLITFNLITFYSIIFNLIIFNLITFNWIIFNLIISNLIKDNFVKFLIKSFNGGQINLKLKKNA